MPAEYARKRLELVEGEQDGLISKMFFNNTLRFSILAGLPAHRQFARDKPTNAIEFHVFRWRNEFGWWRKSVLRFQDPIEALLLLKQARRLDTRSWTFITFLLNFPLNFALELFPMSAQFVGGF